MNIDSEYIRIAQFNANVLEIPFRKKGFQDKSEFQLSVAQLVEEVREFEQAYHDNDYLMAVDSIIDLVYFAKGILYKMGISAREYDECQQAIHNANMTKVRGTKDTRKVDGADNMDAVKPNEWRDPVEAIGLILHG